VLITCQVGVLAEAEAGMRVRAEWIASYRAQQQDNQRQLTVLAAEHQALEQRVVELANTHSAANTEYETKRALVEPELQALVESEVPDEPAEPSEEVPADEDDEERRAREARAQLSASRDREQRKKQALDEKINQHPSVQSSRLGKWPRPGSY
jgi:septal ring factor EnvC (AmiA/AmiB activator)